MGILRLMLILGGKNPNIALKQKAFLKNDFNMCIINQKVFTPIRYICNISQSMYRSGFSYKLLLEEVKSPTRLQTALLAFRKRPDLLK